jgi:hypothetical protein
MAAQLLHRLRLLLLAEGDVSQEGPQSANDRKGYLEDILLAQKSPCAHDGDILHYFILNYRLLKVTHEVLTLKSLKLGPSLLQAKVEGGVVLAIQHPPHMTTVDPC